MRNARSMLVMLLVLLLCLPACSPQVEQTETGGDETSTEEISTEETSEMVENDLLLDEKSEEFPTVLSGETATQICKYVDENGEIAIIPKDFTVSENEGEHTINTGAVVIGPDGSEFVWIPTTQTELAVRDFGSYFYGGNISSYWDEMELELRGSSRGESTTTQRSNG